MASRWARGSLSESEIAHLKGPALETLNPQSQHAPALLELFKWLLADPGYARRIVRHEKEFRSVLASRRSSADDTELYRRQG